MDLLLGPLEKIGKTFGASQPYLKLELDLKEFYGGTCEDSKNEWEP